MVLVGVIVGLSLLAGAGVVGSAQATAPECSSVSLDGNGTAADPFRVETLDQLQCLGQTPGTSLGSGDHYQLQNDIDASETATWNDGAGFDPIASSDEFFYGTFDGNGFAISNLHIDRPDTERVGLFARLAFLRIGNVSLESVRITGGEETGGLVGYNERGTVSNASVTGTVSGGDETGGLVGANTGDVNDSSATARVDGSDSTGGLVGYSFDTVWNSSAAGSVNGSEQVGGLVGYSRGDVYTSAATGDANGSQSVGGLVGYSQGTVAQSHASGDVTSSDVFVGGFVGLNYGDVTESYATGSVTADGYLGGFVGNNEGDVKGSFAAGSVSATTGTPPYIAGFAGINRDGTITGAYWDYERSGRLDGVGAVGRGEGPGDVTDLSTTDMQGSTYAKELNDLFDSGSWTTVAGDYPDLVSNPRTLSTRHYEAPDNDEMDTILADMETDGDGYLVVRSDRALQAINRDSTARSDDYRLGLDIDASGTNQWNSGDGFSPIGPDANQFSGSFDGDGHVISELYIDRSAKAHVGLFGNVTAGSTIEDIGIESVNISGDDWVAGLVGKNLGGTVRESYVTGNVTGDSSVGGLIGQYEGDGGTITESHATATVTARALVGGLIGYKSGDSSVNGSYATGNVTGTYLLGGLIGTSHKGTIQGSYATGDVDGIEHQIYPIYNIGGLIGDVGAGTTVTESYATGDVTADGPEIGGLVGTNTGGSTVNKSYATGSVTGDTNVGGLVGENDATVTDSYAVGHISGTTNVGGVVGSNNGGTVESVYWDAEATGQSASNGSAARYGLPTERMTGLNATVGLFEFDFGETWQPAATAGGYPVLAADSAFAGSADAYDGLVDGDGSADDPFEVSTVYELQLISERLGAGDSFELVGDINASVTDWWYDEGSGPQGFEPLGNAKTGFNGTFDGGEYAITNLTINRSTDDSVGLFGHLESNGTVRSVTVDAATISGRNDVGSLVGINDGAVNESSVAGAVDGSQRVGGLVGRNDGTVRGSSAFAQVDGTGYVGGLVGQSDTGSSITRSYATGRINGTNSEVGGAVGRNNGTVRMVAATGTVDGFTKVGGLVGLNLAGGDVQQSYATGAVNGTQAGGLVAWNRGGEVRLSYAAGRVDGTAPSVGGLVGYNSADGTIEDSYWDNGTTTQPVGVSPTGGTVTNLTGFGAVGDEGPASEMQGLSAVDTMSSLDFETTWTAVDGYPRLAWSVDTLEFTLATDNLTAGESTTTTVTLTLVDDTTVGATTTSEYSSNDTSVATVDDATVRATGAGTALFTAERAGVTDTATLSVAAAPKQPSSGGGGGSSRPSLELRVTDDETVEVTDARAGSIVRISDETTATAGSLGGRGTVRLDALSIELADDRDFRLSVETFDGGNASGDARDARSNVSTAFETEVRTLSAGYVTVTHNLDPWDIRNATFEFSVREDRLDEFGVSPAAVTLYRQSDGWTALPTDYLGTNGTEARFEATSPGFSSFAVGTGEPLTAVTAVTTTDSVLVAGDSATVTATVENRGGIAAEETVTLTGNGEPVATETLALGAGETAEISLTFQPSAGEYDLTVNGVQGRSLTVAVPPTPEPSTPTVTEAVADGDAEDGFPPGGLLVALVVAGVFGGLLWWYRTR